MLESETKRENAGKSQENPWLLNLKSQPDWKRQVFSLLTDAARPAEVSQHFLFWFQTPGTGMESWCRGHSDPILTQTHTNPALDLCAGTKAPILWAGSRGVWRVDPCLCVRGWMDSNVSLFLCERVRVWGQYVSVWKRERELWCASLWDRMKKTRLFVCGWDWEWSQYVCVSKSILVCVCVNRHVLVYLRQSGVGVSKWVCKRNNSCPCISVIEVIDCVWESGEYMCVYERETAIVCVRACVRDGERACAWVYMRERKRDTEKVGGV